MERKIVEVDEKFLQQMMAGDMPVYRMQQAEAKREQPEPVRDEQPDEDMENPEKEMTRPGKKKKAQRNDYTGIFLEPGRIGYRQQVYISKETFDLISGYLPVIGKRSISMSAYLENIIRRHIEVHKNDINELYEKLNISKPL